MKNFRKDKAGKTSELAITGIILGIVLVVGLLFYIFVYQGVGGGGGFGGTGDCETAPTIVPSIINTLTGASVTPSYSAKVNGGNNISVTSGTTTFIKGDNVELMLSAGNYINKVIKMNNLKCGVNRVDGDIYATSTNTFRIFNTGNNLLTDALCTGSATNQSSSASPISLLVYIDSTTDESTGDLVVVVESTNTTEVDSISLTGEGATPTDVPEFYSVAGAGSIAKAFDVPELLDGESKSYTLTISPESGETIGTNENSIYVTAYSKQGFLEKDGSYQVGVENEDGDTKYEDTWDRDFCII